VEHSAFFIPTAGFWCPFLFIIFLNERLVPLLLNQTMEPLIFFLILLSSHLGGDNKQQIKHWDWQKL